MTSILIVEDDTTVRDTLALNLRAEGSEVFKAAAMAIRASDLPNEFAEALETGGFARREINLTLKG
jgi:DNA-binding response OmpR family regulator